MAKLIRLAQLGGSNSVRQIRMDYLESHSIAKLVFDSDGFGVRPEAFLENTFDVAIIDHRLPGLSGFDFIKTLHTEAKVSQAELGWLYLSSQFSSIDLRVQAFTVGAVDCIFVSDGIEAVARTISNFSKIEADYAVKECLPDISLKALSAGDFQRFSSIFQTLDPKEQAIIRAYAELKTDALISQALQVPKLKVKNTLAKVANMLFLSTRGQLLLFLKQLGSAL